MKLQLTTLASIAVILQSSQALVVKRDDILPTDLPLSGLPIATDLPLSGLPTGLPISGLPTGVPTSIPSPSQVQSEISSALSVASSILLGLLNPTSIPTSPAQAEAEVADLVSVLEETLLGVEATVDSLVLPLPVVGGVVAAAAAGVVGAVDEALDRVVVLASSLAFPGGPTPTLDPPIPTSVVFSALSELQGTLETAEAVLEGLTGGQTTPAAGLGGVLSGLLGGLGL